MLSNLNEQQRLAVLAIEGPVMVFAGAGTGKTRALTYRVAYMVEEQKIAPNQILAITFTNKATNEMRKRLLQLVGEASHKVTISTFHAWCARVLRREIEVLGYSRDFTIADEDEQLKIIGELMKEKSIHKKSFPPRMFQKVINSCKCFDTKPKIPLELSFYNAYEERMKQYNLLDFEDLLIKVEEIFDRCPEILQKYRRFHRYILIDEFQDTNLVQYKIVRKLAEEHRNVFVVGDDDQSIYSFRGTNYENMHLFQKDFPERKMFHLVQNYRSTQTILNGSNQLIKNNMNREPKELFSEVQGESNDVVVFQAYNEKAEVEYIIDQIASLRNRGYEWNEIAILYRSSVLVRNFEIGFLQVGIPYKIYGGVSYMKRREVKDLLAYLKLLVDPTDVFSFKRIVNVPTRGLGDSTIEKIEMFIREEGCSLSEAMNRLEEYLNKNKQDLLLSFKELMENLHEALHEMDLLSFYDYLYQKIDYHSYLQQEENPEEREENVQEFKSILYAMEKDYPELTKEEKLQFIFDEAALADDKTQKRQQQDGVLLSTVHSVKGLEFDAVFVIGLEENLFPNERRFVESEDLEEERRIAYVAVTRARKKLFLTNTKSRLIYGRYVHNKVSRFLMEFSKGNQLLAIESNGRLVESVEKKTKTFIEKNTKQNNYRIGDKVLHTKYGEGVIISIDGDIGQIVFSKKGVITKILLTHQSLSKYD